MCSYNTLKNLFQNSENLNRFRFIYSTQKINYLHNGEYKIQFRIICEDLAVSKFKSK